MPRPAGLPLPLPEPAAAVGEIVTSPRYVSAAVMPNGQVGLLFTNSTTEMRFKRYTSEFAMDPSIQLSTAAPPYPQLATFQGKLVAAYVDTRSPNVGRLVFRTSSDNGVTWAAESTPFGATIFDTSPGMVPLVTTSRDAQTLYVFSASGGAVPQYRSTTDPTLVSWTGPVAAGNGTMRVVEGSQCGNAGAECYRAHNFEFTETATPGLWVVDTASDEGAFMARQNVVGYATGDELQELHFLGQPSRETAIHEFLHGTLARRGLPAGAGHEVRIERFLQRHSRMLGLD